MIKLVTGANGFIGSTLMATLTQEGFAVRGIVRKLALENCIAIGDINANTHWKEVLTDVDTIIHTAARVHIMDNKDQDALATFRKINVDGTLNLAQQAAEKGVKRFIYLSSIKVNGEQTPPNSPFTTNHLPAPQEPYAQSKYEAESQLKQLALETGLEVVIIRPPLVYGPGVKANFLLLMKWVEKGLPLPLGGIKNCRSLLYVGNLVDAITTCITHPNAKNQTFIVSDGEDLSTPALIQKIGKAMGKTPMLLPIPPNFLTLAAKPLGKEDTINRLNGSLAVDSSKIKTTLDWQPPFSVNQGLKETVNWFDENQSK